MSNRRKRSSLIIEEEQQHNQINQENCSQSNRPRYEMGSDDIVRILPHQYIHVLDLSSNVTRVEVGPQTFVRKDHERVVLGPMGMIIVPPQHYCVIRNPVIRGSDNELLLDKLGQVRLSHADLEVRLSQEPFPLYPGEDLEREVTSLTVVATNTALLLKATRDLQDGGQSRIAGDQWLFEGPGTYIPRKEVEVVSTISAIVIRPNQALKLRAQREMKDREGVARVTGEEWLVRKPGSYLPGAYEEVVAIVEAHVLTENTAIWVQATRTFMDDLGKLRKNGEEWHIKLEDMETYIPGVYESVKGVVNITTLTDKQYCVICDPVGGDGKPQFGQRKLVRGEKSFFLLPGERLESGIESNYVLGDNEGLLLRATQTFLDDSTKPPVERKAGDRWLIIGNLEYVPPVQVQVLEHRSAIPLHDNEGIYVRNTKTGHVRAVIGKTYMLSQDEELWEKHVPATVRELLSSDHDALADRAMMRGFATDSARKNKEPGYTRVITYQVPHNAAVQIYDYKDKRSRVVFGPDLVMLGPDEQFTQLSLSGGRPKKPNTIRSLALLLGPDFFTDVITVETADHARLSLQLAYNWHFDTGDRSIEAATRLFNIPDFVGDASKALASRIRGAVAAVNFDHFHKSSAHVIRTAVFSLDENQKVRDKFVFSQNNLIITSVDIQNVEPVDQRTRDALQKSVQLAIEITTNSQEASAKHEAERLEQEAKGRLERQKLTDAASAEKARTELLELKAASAGVESCGLAEAEARSRTHAARIVAEGAVMEARLKSKAKRIETMAELERLQKAREAELLFMRAKSEIEVTQAREMAALEGGSFKQMVEAIGSDNLRMMATAGPEQQVRLLKALGLKSTIITDGRTPLNLLSTGLGLIGANSGAESHLQVAPVSHAFGSEQGD